MTMMVMTVTMMMMTMMVSAADEGTMKGTRWTPVGINQPCHDSLNLNAAGQQWWEVYGCTYHRNNFSQFIRNTKILKHFRVKIKFIDYFWVLGRYFSSSVQVLLQTHKGRGTTLQTVPYFGARWTLFLTILYFVIPFNQFSNWVIINSQDWSSSTWLSIAWDLKYKS